MSERINAFARRSLPTARGATPANFYRILFSSFCSLDFLQKDSSCSQFLVSVVNRLKPTFYFSGNLRIAIILRDNFQPPFLQLYNLQYFSCLTLDTFLSPSCPVPNRPPQPQFSDPSQPPPRLRETQARDPESRDTVCAVGPNSKM